MSVEGMSEAQFFSLRWNNHPANLVSVFSGLYSSETLVDVTLAAEGKHLQAHKMLLSACSEYFQALFAVNPCKHPIVILKDIRFDDLQTVVQFMYHGVVNVSSEKLPAVLKTADTLRIKGLGEKFSETVNQFVNNTSNKTNSNNLRTVANSSLLSRVASTSSPRLLSVPSQHSVSSINSIRQHSTESLPDFLLRPGMAETRQWSVESSSSTSKLAKHQSLSTSPPPRILSKKFRRVSASYDHQPQVSPNSAVEMSPTRQSSSSTDPGSINAATTTSNVSTSGVAKKKRELFSARSSRGSNQSSVSDQEIGFKRTSSGSSNQSQSQEETMKTTSTNTTIVSKSKLSVPIDKVLPPGPRTISRTQSAGSVETPTDLSSPKSPSGSKRARLLRRQDCLEKGMDLTTSTESGQDDNLSVVDSNLAVPTVVRSMPNSPLIFDSAHHDIRTSPIPPRPTMDTTEDSSVLVPNMQLLCPPEMNKPRWISEPAVPSVLVTDTDAPGPYQPQLPFGPPLAATNYGNYGVISGVSGSNVGETSKSEELPSFGHCPKARDGPALGCNYCWNTTDNTGRILRRKTKYHCPECQANLCIVPCFQLFHEALEKEGKAKRANLSHEAKLHH